MNVALAARARQAGWDLPTDDDGLVKLSEAQMRELMLPWMGSAVGRSFRAEEDAADLWETLKHIARCHTAMCRAIDAEGIHPKIANLGDMPPPDWSGDEPPRYDPRTEAERAAGAISAWDAIQDHLRARNPLHVRAIVRAVLFDEAWPGAADVLRKLKEDMGR